MRKSLILLAAGSALALAGCNSHKTEADAAASEASADDAVNLATDVSPDVAETTVPPASQSPDPMAEPGSPTPEAKSGGTAAVQQ